MTPLDPLQRLAVAARSALGGVAAAVVVVDGEASVLAAATAGVHEAVLCATAVRAVQDGTTATSEVGPVRCVAHPVAGGGGLRGALAVTASGPGPWSERDLTVVADLATAVTAVLLVTDAFDQGEALLAQGRTEVRQLRHLDKVKDDLVAVVSHELRTPLATINGFLELLAEDPSLSEQQREFVSLSTVTAAQLRRLADDLLDVTRFESGNLSLHLDSLDLAGLVAEATAAHAPAAEAAALALTCDLRATPLVDADRQRIRQVLDNLLSNAVKYTPPGGCITVSTGEADGAAVVSVADTGYGIPEDERDRLFDRFFRASTAVDRGIRGTGLGLAVSRALVEAHGGSLVADPVTPGGTVFVVRLPARR